MPAGRAAAKLLMAFALFPGPALADPAPADSPAPAARVTAARRETDFYRALPYGSESLVHPLRMILNGGLGILQLDNLDDRVNRIDFAGGWYVVMNNITDPLAAIEREGWSRFLAQEIAPFSTSVEGARYWPNYTLHLIGGGMSYRLTTEWFEYRGTRHPRLWAAGTMLGYHLVNEVVESATQKGPTTDPVADLLFFDPLGIALFEIDGVSRFFGRTLHMADWSYQPAYDPVSGRLENVGQNFAIRIPIPGTLERWSVLYYFGTHGEMGISRRLDNGDSWSLAGGFGASNLADLGNGVRTVDLVPAAGLFWDRHNSLMASLLYARTKAYQWRLNVYPGVVPMGGLRPGFFLATTHEGRIAGGITIGSLTHLPVGVGGTIAD